MIPEVDWIKLTADLKKECFVATIAKACGLTVAMVASYGRGTKPSHHSGENLIDFWQRTTGKPLSEVPRKSA